MSRAPAKITQADIVRAIKAAERMGKACEVEIRRDGSTIVPPGGKPFPIPRFECSRSTPYAYERDRAEALDSIGWFGQGRA